jgi:hypothetical protein
MYATKCPSCSQPITLKTEEIREAVAEAESHNYSHYQMACPKCRRPVKIPVKLLKLKIPRQTTEPTEAASEPTTESGSEKQ